MYVFVFLRLPLSRKEIKKLSEVDSDLQRAEIAIKACFSVVVSGVRGEGERVRWGGVLLLPPAGAARPAWRRRQAQATRLRIQGQVHSGQCRVKTM